MQKMMQSPRQGRGWFGGAAIVRAAVYCLGCAILFGAPAGAVTITDLTTNTILFRDNFESGDFNHPAVGVWGIFGPDVTVTNAASPGAAQGSDYAQLFRNSDLNNQGNLRASFNPPAASDVILLQMMVYLPSFTDTNARGQFILDDGDFNTARAWLQPDGSGNVNAIGPGQSITSTGLHYTTDAWEEWDLRYNGNGTFSVSIGGVSAATSFSSLSTGAINSADLFNGAKSPAGSFFLDALPDQTQPPVPEPASFWLLSGALGAMAGIRAKKLARR
jgi:hypothetical protein